uniref:Protein kinase domain-containing protein n=1 Tax=Globodera pallida TaxID=36090 RepID=A0A183BW57_GLOPA
MFKNNFLQPKQQPLLDEQCKYLFRMANEMKDDEQRFNFVHGHICAVEDGMREGEQKKKVVKSMASWALKEFNAKDGYKMDVRMLDFWKFLGKYSDDLKMEGVMENVHRLGHFKAQAAFYLLWAEHWASLGNRRNFDRTVTMCENNCSIDPFECNELFKPLVSKYFGEPSEETSNTMELIKVLAERPNEVRRTLTMFPDRTTINLRTTRIIGEEQTTKPKLQEQQQPLVTSQEEFSIFQDPTTLVALTEVAKQQKNSENTAAKQMQGAASTSTVAIEPKSAVTSEERAEIVGEKPAGSREGFSIYREPTVTQQIEPPTQKEVVVQPSFLSVGDDVDLLDHVTGKEPPQPLQSMLCGDVDDITLSGAHGKFAPNVFTSTPRRSVAFLAFDPLLMEMDDDGLMGPPPTPSRNDRIGELFAPMPDVGGSKLQRRLSLAGDFPTHSEKLSTNQIAGPRKSTNEISKAMPHLKIGSTIAEETEEEEKENSLVSPYRKKQRQAPTPSRPASQAPHIQPEPMAQQLPQNASQPLEVLAQLPEKHFDPDGTHLGTVIEKIKTGTENPWDEEKRKKVLRAAHVMVECHEFLYEKCPRIELNRAADLGGESFFVEKLLGQGGFARVYKAISRENCRAYAIKYEAPACPWEVYICSALKQRVPSKFVAYLMEVRDAYIFKNASAIVYDFYPNGTLLDLSNVYRRNGAEMSGLLATFFGIQLARALQQIHQVANIIHADVKPDNVILLTSSLNDRASLEELMNTPVLKLIDWGRSIDMDQFKGVEFVGKAGTENFDCVEMKMGMPWTFQTDFYGFCATMYVMMKGEYLVTFKYSQTDKIVPVKQLKRRMALHDLWTQLFEQFLNIPDCKQLPKWSNALRCMEDRLTEAVKVDPLEWKKALERFNAFAKQKE